MAMFPTKPSRPSSPATFKRNLRVELAGAVFVDEPVTVDGTLVTSRGWPDLPYFMPKFLEVLGGR